MPYALSSTERGFGNYAELKDTYGLDVTVRQSSAATRDCVWIFIGEGEEAKAAHLTYDDALKVATGLLGWMSDCTGSEFKIEFSRREKGKKVRK